MLKTRKKKKKPNPEASLHKSASTSPRVSGRPQTTPPLPFFLISNLYRKGCCVGGWLFISVMVSPISFQRQTSSLQRCFPSPSCEWDWKWGQCSLIKGEGVSEEHWMLRKGKKIHVKKPWWK